MVHGSRRIFLNGFVVLALNIGAVVAKLYDSPLTLANESEGMQGIVTLTDSDMECAFGYFRCNETTPLTCIAQNSICDGTVDCEDGTDEWNCDDPINSFYFDNNFRKNPAAQSDDITMGECVWKEGINRTNCDCKGDELHCQHKHFYKLPSYLPDDGITLLDLTGNDFSVLNKGFFDTLPEVGILGLSHCSITEISSDAFRVLSRIDLHTIYLNQNRITSLPDRFFPPQNRLQMLILRGNLITELPITSFTNLNYLIELDLQENRIVALNADVFRPLISLEILLLNSNQIKILTSNMIPALNNLLTLNLNNNSIDFISIDALWLPSLRHLFLAENKLKQLLNDTFQNLPNLLGLYLNDNEINEIQLTSLHGVENLTSLNLNRNPFYIVRTGIFKHLLKLEHVYFRWFYLCRAVLHVRDCHPKTDGISSNLHLLDNSLLRRSVWIMGGIAIFGNILVLLGRCLIRSKRGHHNIEHDLFLKNLAASDLLMGVYLAIIACADIQFRGVYLVHDEEWRHSITCAICGFLSTLSCQSSTLLLSLVTWDRLISVTRPLQPRSSSRFRAILRLSILWCVAGLAAFSPFLNEEYFGKHFYGNNGVCLSVHIHDPYSKGWEYSACLFICVNTLALLFIVFSYARMLKAIRGSGEAMRSTVSGRENAVARRFAIIVLTDCACWLPIIVVKLAALTGKEIQESLYAWLAVFVLPVNSALNPVLYTLTTAAFKQQMNKIYSTLPCAISSESPNNIGYESGMSFSLGHNPNNGATKHLLQRRTTQTTLTFSCKRPTIV